MLSSIGRFVSLLIAAVVGGIIASWFFRAPAPQQPSASAPQFYASPEALGVEVTDMPAAARVELGGYVEARDVVRLTAQAPGRIVYHRRTGRRPRGRRAGCRVARRRCAAA